MKIGEDHAKHMLTKGIEELRELGHFSSTGNIAQPNIHWLGAAPEHSQEAAKPEIAPEQGHEIERER